MASDKYILPKEPNNQLQNIGENYVPVKPQDNFTGEKVPFYDGIKPITQTQQQVSQLEIKYAGPLVKDSIVENLEDLINPEKFSMQLNYQHRRVWVKEYACEYYLDNGDGTRLEHWKRAIGRLVVRTWSAFENYQEGDIVNYFGKLYVAKQNITVPTEIQVDSNGNIVYDKNRLPVYNLKPNINIYNQYLDSPLINENLWQVVTGEIETYSWHFPNTNQIQIWTEIRNPRFEVCLGEIYRDEETGEIHYNAETGLPIYKNIEIVEACIRQGVLNKETGEVIQDINNLDDGKGNITEDSNPDEGGVPYVIQLFTDEKLLDTYYDIETVGEDKTQRTNFNIIVSIK